MVTQSAQVINVNDESEEEIEQQSIHLKDAEAQTDEATVDVLKEQLADCHKIKVSYQHWRSKSYCKCEDTDTLNV